MLVCIVILFFKQKTAYEMRISDWSSDVCSSDLAVPPGRTATGTVDRVMIRATGDSWVQVRDAQGAALFTRVLREGDVYRVPEQSGLRLATGNAGDRKSVVSGKRVSVRVDLGGRRIIKKKKKTNEHEEV